jgi:hypothetical protein
LQRRQFTAPIFTGFGVEVRVRSAATQQRVALKEPINDLFGVRFVVVDSRIRKFPQLDKAKARRNHGFALFLIHSRPFRCGMKRLCFPARLPGTAKRIFNRLNNFVSPHKSPAVCNTAFQEAHNFAGW